MYLNQNTAQYRFNGPVGNEHPPMTGFQCIQMGLVQIVSFNRFQLKCVRPIPADTLGLQSDLDINISTSGT